MFRALLERLGLLARVPLALLIAAALLLPLLGLRADLTLGDFAAEDLVSRGSAVGALMAFLSVAAGGAIAWTVAAMDDGDRRAYVLSLPVGRGRLALVRAMAGALALLPIATAIWLGVVMGAAQTTLPPGVHAYAFATAVRALAVMWLTYALVLAARSVRSVGVRRAVVFVPLALVAAVWVERMVLSRSHREPPISRALYTTFTHPASPFSLVFSPWRVLDL